MVDTSLILRKLALLEQYQQQLQEFSGITLEAYRNDWKIQRIVERTLQMMIELCTDIAGHIISDNSLRIPESYADTFKILGENNILPEDLEQTMVKMAKFRNIVVHQYENVDAEIVILILRRHLDDFKKIESALLGFLKS